MSKFAKKLTLTYPFPEVQGPKMLSKLHKMSTFHCSPLGAMFLKLHKTYIYMLRNELSLLDETPGIVNVGFSFCFVLFIS